MNVHFSARLKPNFLHCFHDTQFSVDRPSHFQLVRFSILAWFFSAKKVKRKQRNDFDGIRLYANIVYPYVEWFSEEKEKKNGLFTARKLQVIGNLFNVYTAWSESWQIFHTFLFVNKNMLCCSISCEYTNCFRIEPTMERQTFYRFSISKNIWFH